MERGIEAREAVELLGLRGEERLGLLERADAVRRRTRGDGVGFCSIVNARSGACGEDCAFCAQSRRSRAEVAAYPLLPAERLVEAARRAVADGASCFGIVTAGRTVGRREDLETIARAVGEISRRLPIRVAASLGLLDDAALGRLRDAGLDHLHHNLETAESFFPQVCSTHRWSESVEALHRARRAGFTLCCGGIVGLGESEAQRVELLVAVRQLAPDSVPLNFFHPVPGTPLGHLPLLDPMEALALVAVARLLMPDRDIRVCGGRERVLGDLQDRLLRSGADGMMVGGYLTTPGRPAAADRDMAAAAGMRLRRAERTCAGTIRMV